MAASEAAPFVKTGGLADVLGSLPAAMVRAGEDVAVVLPKYRGLHPEGIELVYEDMPVWIAGVRQALFPGGPSSIGGAGSMWLRVSGELNPNSLQIVLVLLATGAVVTLGSALLFRVGEGRARDRGLIDQTTGS